MTDVAKMIAELEEAERAATPGPWHHVQAFQKVPSETAVHGRVPAQRVDYVSTWPGPGTPKGHRVVVPMETVAEGHVIRTASSEDMALIALMRNALPALIEALKRQREAFSGPAAWLDSWAQHVGNCKGGCVCTCGLTLARIEAAAALQETTGD